MSTVVVGSAADGAGTLALASCTGATHVSDGVVSIGSSAPVEEDESEPVEELSSPADDDSAPIEELSFPVEDDGD
jgi:hypothetical protein